MNEIRASAAAVPSVIDGLSLLVSHTLAAANHSSCYRLSPGFSPFFEMSQTGVVAGGGGLRSAGAFAGSYVTHLSQLVLCSLVPAFSSCRARWLRWRQGVKQDTHESATSTVLTNDIMGDSVPQPLQKWSQFVCYYTIYFPLFLFMSLFVCFYKLLICVCLFVSRKLTVVFL